MVMVLWYGGDKMNSGERYITCADCDGTGEIYLEYIDRYNSVDVLHSEERWLPCAACDGTGKLARTESQKGCAWYGGAILGVVLSIFDR